MVSFRIIEESYDNMNNIYEEFKKDFINPEVKVSVIKEKYDLSPSQYRDLKNRVLTDTGLTMKPSKCGYGNIVENKDKYIAYTKSAYVKIGRAHV